MHAMYVSALSRSSPQLRCSLGVNRVLLLLLKMLGLKLMMLIAELRWPGSLQLSIARAGTARADLTEIWYLATVDGSCGPVGRSPGSGRGLVVLAGPHNDPSHAPCCWHCRAIVDLLALRGGGHPHSGMRSVSNGAWSPCMQGRLPPHLARERAAKASLLLLLLQLQLLLLLFLLFFQFIYSLAFEVALAGVGVALLTCCELQEPFSDCPGPGFGPEAARDGRGFAKCLIGQLPMLLRREVHDHLDGENCRSSSKLYCRRRSRRPRIPRGKGLRREVGRLLTEGHFLPLPRASSEEKPRRKADGQERASSIRKFFHGQLIGTMFPLQSRED
mmetsp:Transcript_88849/g.194704  ORF Transcript_88849/g.194704 Transcript_88849/m.194704 type:complete len:331 (+) Transcript_88849:29-1021(+)